MNEVIKHPRKILIDSHHALKQLEPSGLKVNIEDSFILTIENLTQGKPLKLTKEQALALSVHLPAIVEAMSLQP